jgi:hypothetical protein
VEQGDQVIHMEQRVEAAPVVLVVVVMVEQVDLLHQAL